MLSALTGSLRLLRPRERFIVAVLATATLFLNALDIVAISLIGVIGGVAVGEISSGLTSWIPSDLGTYDVMLYLLLVAAALFTLKTLAGILIARLREQFLASLETKFSADIVRHFFSGGLAVLKSTPKSDLEWAVLRSTRIAFGKMIGITLSLFSEVSLAIAILVLFLVVDWKSGVAVFLYFALILLAFHLASRRAMRKTGAGFTKGSVGVAQHMTDLVAAYKETFVLGRVSFFIDRIITARRLVAASQARQSYLEAIPRLIVELGLIVGAIGFLIFQLASNEGEPNLAVVGVFIVGSLRMMSALLPIQRGFMQLKFEAPQAAAAQSILWSAANKSVVPNPVRAGSLDSFDGSKALAVEVSDVCFSYTDRDSHQPVLEDVNLEITAGQTVAVIGKSGAGKSTLMDLILGLQAPVSGRVRIAGKDPKEILEHHPGLIGYVPQKPGLVSGSIRDNIALGVSPEAVDEHLLWEAVDSADIRSFIDSLPYGIESDIGSHADALSGGQTQRIGLARALYNRPRLLVLDEATSALDADTEATISSSLGLSSEERTTIIVAHRLSTIQGVDLVFVMENGRVIASGELNDLRKRVPLVRRYIELMSFIDG